jgi:spermidine synthase
MEQVVFRGHNGQYPVLVTDAGPLRSLSFGTEERQSCIDLASPHTLQLAYTQWMITALTLPPCPRNFLVIGLGGGALPHFLLHHHPEARIDVVEKDRLVIALAHGYFRLPHHPALRIVHRDALSFLRDDHGCGYNVAFLDIFGPGCMAPALFDSALYSLLLERLSPEGVLAVNLWSGDKPLYHQALRAADEACGGQLLQMQVKKRSNVILLLFPGEIPHRAIKHAQKQSAELRKRYGLDFSLYLKRLRRTNRLSLLSTLFD